MSSKISALGELESPASGDLIPVVDVSDTTTAVTGKNKKMTLSQFLLSGNNLSDLLDSAVARANLGAVSLAALCERDLDRAELTIGLCDFLDPIGFADGFNNTAGIDSSHSTNYDTTEAGVLKPYFGPGSYTPAASITPTTTSTAYGGYTYRTMIAAAQLADVTKGAVRVRIHAPVSGSPMAIANAFIGVLSGTYGFAGTPTRLTFSGNNGVSIPVGSGYIWSDPVAFSYTGTTALCISHAGTSGSVPYYNGTSTGWTSAWKAGAGDASNASPTGYTTPAIATYGISGIEVTDFANGNMSVCSVSRTAVMSPPVTADVYALVEETDALTLNTDFILSASRNGNTSYVAGTATKLGTFPNGLSLIVATGIDLTGQGSASDLRWKVTTANGKRCKVHAVGIYVQ